MLYPARWKRITVDQSKVLKNRLFHFFGATRYMHVWLFLVGQISCTWSASAWRPGSCPSSSGTTPGCLSCFQTVSFTNESAATPSSTAARSCWPWPAPPSPPSTSTPGSPRSCAGHTRWDIATAGLSICSHSHWGGGGGGLPTHFFFSYKFFLGGHLPPTWPTSFGEKQKKKGGGG